MTDIDDSMEYRRANKIRGPRGTDWYKYYDGVMPDDEELAYTWNGSQWVVDWQYEEWWENKYAT